MAKRPKQAGSPSGCIRLDRISGLPIHLLHHVLSFLPTHDVVRTCVLSKKWRNFWCSVPTLDFNADLFRGRDFVKYVDFVLILRDGSNVQKFRLIPQDEMDRSRANNWIIYALRHNVEVLHILNDFEPINLNPQLFTCESLREFKLSSNKLSLPASTYLPALRVLHLILVNLQDGQLIRLLLSATPSLTTLILEDCIFECSILTIYSFQLKNLTMCGVFPSVIVITALNLTSFKLSISNQRKVNIEFNGNLKSLSDANINIGRAWSASMTQLISVIQSAQYMTLSGLFLLSFARKLQEEGNLSLQNGIQIPFCNLKMLKIETLFSDGEIILINNILMNSPEIESIFLEKDTYYYDKAHVQCDEDEQVWFKYKLSRLKLVEIRGFRGSKNEVKMVKFFLENAFVLEKLIIVIAKPNALMKKIGRKLLTYPRASSSVGILFAQNM